MSRNHNELESNDYELLIRDGVFTFLCQQFFEKIFYLLESDHDWILPRGMSVRILAGPMTKDNAKTKRRFNTPRRGQHPAMSSS